ncbi:hypothetical protein FACS1894106_2620 [Spirochaetia bacterium]|nr:hypothetical protein FACS1894106_2620 [Spirochaetia bacterium]
MREIIFRGQQVRGSFITGHYYVNEEGKHLICFTEKRRRFYGETMEYGEYQVAPETIGQYTGRLDCDQKKIFEGDIVDILNEDTEIIGRGRIEFLEGWGLWYVDSVDSFEADHAHGKMNHANDGLGDILYEYSVKIIGNVHDNPELLKGKDAV